MSTSLACPSLVIRSYDDPSAFSLLEEEWRRLFQQCGGWNVFLSWQWFRHWWSHFGAGNQLQLLSLSREDRLVGIVPMMVEPADDGCLQLALIGEDRTTDYGDLLAEPSSCDAMIEALAGFVGEGFGRWQRVEFRSVPMGSPLLEPFLDAVHRRGIVSEVRVAGTCPRAILRPTWEEYLAGLGKKDRHELRRKIRRAQAAGDQDILSLRGQQEVADHLDSFFRLHRASAPDKAEFLDEGMSSFFWDLFLTFAEEGWLRLNLMRIDGHEVAASVSFSRGDRVLLYNSGLDPDYRTHSVGIALHAAEMERAIDDRKTVYDFLRGDEPYKYGLGAQDSPIYTITLLPPGGSAADGKGRAE